MFNLRKPPKGVKKSRIDHDAEIIVNRSRMFFSAPHLLRALYHQMAQRIRQILAL